MGIKQSTSALVQTYKNVFLAKFYCKFLAFFFLLFCAKNAENDYFNQHLVGAAPKGWSKYTTIV